MTVPERHGAGMVRASDAERDRTVVLLRDAAGEGRLTFEELADRIEAAAGATTRGELERLTSDLPVPAGAITEGVVAANESKLFGDVRRTGAWAVPVQGKYETLFGDVVLDLRQATVTAEEMTIDAGTIFGDVELLVPESVAVEVRSRTLFGTVKQEAGQVSAPGAPKVVVVGGTVFGDVRVRAKRLRERLAERLRA